MNDVAEMFAVALKSPDVEYQSHEFLEIAGKRRLEIAFTVPAIEKTGHIASVFENDSDLPGVIRALARGAIDWAHHKINKDCQDHRHKGRAP
jgi:hypothetical protein